MAYITLKSQSRSSSRYAAGPTTNSWMSLPLQKLSILVLFITFLWIPILPCRPFLLCVFHFLSKDMVKLPQQVFRAVLTVHAGTWHARVTRNKNVMAKHKVCIAAVVVLTPVNTVAATATAAESAKIYSAIQNNTFTLVSVLLYNTASVHIGQSWLECTMDVRRSHDALRRASVRLSVIWGC